MNPLPTRQSCNDNVICALIEFHHNHSDLFSYHEDRYTRYGEPVYEYEGVRPEGYLHSEDNSFFIRVEEATESDNDFIADYNTLVELMRDHTHLSATNTEKRRYNNEDGEGTIKLRSTEFEVVDGAEWDVPTLLQYGHISPPDERSMDYFCDRNNLEWFKIRNHFVVRGASATDEFRSASYMEARVSDTLNESTTGKANIFNF